MIAYSLRIKSHGPSHRPDSPKPLDRLYSYYVAEDWTPKKMEVEVPVPDTLDLESLRGTGPAAGEKLQPEETDKEQQAAPSAAGPVPDDAIVASLVSMGFSENGSKRAGAWRCFPALMWLSAC